MQGPTSPASASRWSLLWKALAVLAFAFSTGAYLYFVSVHERAPALQTPKQRVTVANIGLYSIFNIIAREKGYFAAHGLEVEVEEYDSGATAMAALLSGRVDFTVAADFVGVRNMFARPDIRVLSMMSRQDNFHLIGRQSSGITKPADLRGKKIGVTKNTAGEFLLSRFLTNNGLKDTDVVSVDATPALMKEGLEDGTFDAIVIFQPHVYELERRYGNEMVSWSTQGDLRVMAFLYTLQPTIETSPDIVHAYVAALADADRYVRENPADAQRIVAGAMGFDPEYLRYIWDKLQFTLAMDQDMLLLAEEDARWLIGSGAVAQKTVPNFLDYMYFDALKAAKPGSVTIVH